MAPAGSANGSFALEGRRALIGTPILGVARVKVNDSGAGFGTGTNLVTLLFRDGRREQLPLADKKIVAAAIVDQLAGLAPA